MAIFAFTSPSHRWNKVIIFEVIVKKLFTITFELIDKTRQLFTLTSKERETFTLSD